MMETNSNEDPVRPPDIRPPRYARDIVAAMTDAEERARRVTFRRLFGVLAGVVVVPALLVVALSVLLFSSTLAPLPPPTTPATLPPPTSAALPPNTALWSDTARRVTVVYPLAWKKSLPSDSHLLLTARDGTTFLLYDTNFNRSPAAGMAAIQQEQAAETASDYDPDNATRNYTPGVVRQTTVGGEPALLMPYAYVSKRAPTGPVHHGEVLTVAHGGFQYVIQVEYGDAGQNADVDGIIASLHFIVPAAPDAP